MKLFLLVVTGVCLCASTLQGRSVDWFDRRMKELELATKKESTSDRIAALGEFMSIGSHGAMDDQRRDVFQKAQSAILAIPGHAKYYQDKIEAMREEVLVNSKKSEAEITKIQDEGVEIMDVWAYEAYCVNAFRTLAHIPSSECVAVLGFYLNDPVGRDGKTLLGDKRSNPGDDFNPRAINSEGAAIAIRKLGIEHPPFKLYDDRGVAFVSEGEVDAWKDWWNEVKDGKRTYRFIGSPIEYGPDGPAPSEAIQRAQRIMKRDEERETGNRKSPIAPATGSPAAVAAKHRSIAGILAACALIGAAVWYFLKHRRTA